MPVPSWIRVPSRLPPATRPERYWRGDHIRTWRTTERIWIPTTPRSTDTQSAVTVRASCAGDKATYTVDAGVVSVDVTHAGTELVGSTVDHHSFVTILTRTTGILGEDLIGGEAETCRDQWSGVGELDSGFHDGPASGSGRERFDDLFACHMTTSLHYRRNSASRHSP